MSKYRLDKSQETDLKPFNDTFAAPKADPKSFRDTFAVPKADPKLFRNTFAAPKADPKSFRNTFAAPKADPKSFRNTFAAPSNSQSGIDDISIASSDKSNITKELTKLEDNSLRHSFRAVNSYNQSTRDDDFEDPRNPSAELSQKIERMSGVNRTYDWDQTDLRSSPVMIHQINTDVRDGTPDSTASSGNRMFMNSRDGHRTQFNAANINTNTNNNFAKSMRAQLSHLSADQQYTSASNGAYASYQNHYANVDVQEKNPEGATKEKDSQETEEKEIWCMPRCLLLGMAVMIIIAGIVAVIVVFRSSNPERSTGNVIPNPITHKECSDLLYNLGTKMNISCTFDTNHEYREKLEKTSDIIVRSPNLAIKESRFTAMVRDRLGEGIFRWDIIGPSVTCSSEGTYQLDFKDESGNLLHTATAVLQVNTSTVKTKIRQSHDYNMNETTFHFECSISSVCNNYDVDLIARSNKDYNLVSSKRCDVNFTDATGYSINCTGTLNDTLVDRFGYMGCRLTHGKTVMTEEFVFPECGLETGKCSYNCSIDHEDFKQLNQSNCKYSKMKECFKPSREIYSYSLCPNNVYPCDQSVQVDVCRLSWCKRNTIGSRPIKSENNPGTQLCPDFKERIATTTTTFTNTSSTTTPKPSTKPITTLEPTITSTATPKPTTTSTTIP